MKVYVKEFEKGLYTEPEDGYPFISKKGDWIDLRIAKDMTFKAPMAGRLSTNADGSKRRIVKFDEQLIPLGIAMKLPKGMCAEIRQRSSLTMKLRVFPLTSGAVDNVYNGNNDQWYMYAAAIADTEIKKGTRIAQFRIIPSQFANTSQKLRWLLTGLHFEFVDHLDSTDRGGHGSTGV